MARHGDTRSPSPVGSSYSTSRRSRKDEDRYDRSHRDDGRGYRRRSRSRSPDRRHRGDRDSHRRRDRSVDRRDYREDRHDEDSYRPNRRDRSREKRRSRDRDDGRDYRRRSRDRDRDRDFRNRRDDSRERTRRRREDSTDSRRKDRRDTSRDRGSNRNLDTRSREDSKPSTPTAQTAEEKKAERLAKLEAWKQKQAAERERKQKELEAAGGARSILDEIDRKSNASPAVFSPMTPGTPSDTNSPLPYAGKFDPKAIAKKATLSSSGSSLLGKDINLPDIAKALKKLFYFLQHRTPQSSWECQWFRFRQ